MKVWEKKKKELTFDTLFNLLYQTDDNPIVVKKLCDKYIKYDRAIDDFVCTSGHDCKDCIKYWLESDCE